MVYFHSMPAFFVAAVTLLAVALLLGSFALGFVVGLRVKREAIVAAPSLRGLPTAREIYSTVQQAVHGTSRVSDKYRTISEDEEYGRTRHTRQESIP